MPRLARHRGQVISGAIKGMYFHTDTASNSSIGISKLQMIQDSRDRPYKDNALHYLYLDSLVSIDYPAAGFPLIPQHPADTYAGINAS